MSTTLMEETIEASQPAEEQASAAQTSQIVGFRLANEEYGVEIMRVQEIILIGHITPMPHVPDYVRGLINLRGSVIPIIDLRLRFSLGPAETTEHSRIIVLNLESRTVGIIVDAVNEVLRINLAQIEPAPTAITGIGHEYLSGLVKLEDKLIILLNTERLTEQADAAPARGQTPRSE